MNSNNSSKAPPQQALGLQGVMWTVAFGLESFFIVIANLLTVAVFLTGRQLRKRSTYCLINLSAADLLVGIVPIPLFVYIVGVQHALWRPMWDIHSWSNVYMPIDMIGAFASMFCLVLLALERIYATLLPFQHRQLADRGYILAILAVWSTACAVSLSSFFSLAFFQSKAMSTYIGMSALSFAVLVMVTAYFVIWIKVKCFNKRHGEGCQAGRKMQYERKLAVTLFIVTAASLLTWLPFVILTTVAMFYPIDIDFSLVLAVKLLHYSNSLINPIIYTFRIREFRRALNGFLRGRGSSYAMPSGHIPQDALRMDQMQIRIGSLRS